MTKFDSLIESISSKLDENAFAALNTDPKILPGSKEISKNFKEPSTTNPTTNSNTSSSSTPQPNQPNDDEQNKNQQDSNASLAELQKQLAQLQKDLEAGGEEMEQKAIVDKIANLQKLIATATKTTVN